MKNNKGITLIALSITIVILLILAFVTINFGTKSINNAKLETLKTNMLLIKAKAKEYCEEANFKVGTGSVPTDQQELENYLKPGVDYLKEKNLTTNGSSALLGITSTTYQYVVELTQNNLDEIGLKDVKTTNDDKYLIGFNITQDKVEVYNTKGIDGKYSLTEIENIKD